MMYDNIPEDDVIILTSSNLSGFMEFQAAKFKCKCAQRNCQLQVKGSC